MPKGPGNYNDVCTQVREQTQALGAVLIIFDGDRGNGFSVQAPEELSVQLPEILEFVAATIGSDSDIPRKRTH